MAEARLAVLEHQVDQAHMLYLVPPPVEDADAVALPPEYRYEPLNHDAFFVPWLASPLDGVIRSGQTWFIVDDNKHANPLWGEMRISFDSGTIPIVVLDRRATQSMESFLRDVIAGNAWYVETSFVCSVAAKKP